MPQIVDCVIVGLALAARARSFEKAHFNVATTYFYFRRFDDGEFMQPQARARWPCQSSRLFISLRHFFPNQAMLNSLFPDSETVFRMLAGVAACRSPMWIGLAMGTQL